MKKYIPVLFLLVLGSLPASSQDRYDPRKALTSEELFFKQNGNQKSLANAGQKYLALDYSPLMGGFRRYRFFEGDKIKFRMRNEKIRFNETIASITDSSFAIGVTNEAAGRMDYQEILFRNIRLIKVSRRIPFVTEAAIYFPMAGLIYIGADFVNKGVDDKRFTSDASALIVGGALMTAGLVCYKLSFSTIKINDRNKIKVLETY